MKQGWQHFSHDADLGVRGTADTLEQAFAQAALALTAAVTDLARVVAEIPVEIVCEAPDDELLLVDWLNSVIYEMAVRHMLFGRFDVRIDCGRLQAIAWGEPVDVARHQPAVEPKGATFTELKVAREINGWIAQCIVDV